MWRSLQVPAAELRVQWNLHCGQSFRWKQTGDMEWTSVLQGQLVSLRQTEHDTLYCCHNTQTKSPPADNTEHLLRDYFQLHVHLAECYERWSQDRVFRERAAHIRGIRILRLDPVENLFSFICSSNNNIPRITQMVDNLCKNFGQRVGSVAGVEFFAFPEVSDLVGSEARLRELGFGYRAKYIDQTAQLLCNQHTSPSEFLLSLRKRTYSEAREELLKLAGVGPKVADCICLMSLDKCQVIPVDTHVRAIAERLYRVTVPGKSLTEAGYRKIQQHFETLFGQDAGWAHSVLFTADLRQFEQQAIDLKATAESLSQKASTEPIKAAGTKRKRRTTQAGR